jgi:two-component system, chemotaxis family, sensor kinase CheA
MAGDPFRYFRIEARELSDEIAGGVLDLDTAADRAGTLARILRAAHTLKGAARVVRQAAIAEAAHALEDVLQPHRGDAGTLPPDATADLLARVDAIEAGIAALPPAAPEPPEPPAPTAPTAPGPSAAPTAPGPAAAPATVDEPAVPSAPDADALTVIRTDATDVDDLLEAIGETQAHLAPLRHGVAELDRIRRGLDLLRAQLDGLVGARHTGDHGDPAERAATGNRIRAMTVGLGNDLAAVEHDLAGSLEHGERELRQIRVAAEQLRLVRAGSVLPALHRAARDAAAQAGCRIAFHATGGDTRLDPQVLSTVYGALLHTVRNAVAHGIEPVDHRREAGKPDEGRVAVAIERRGTRIVFSCRDDGRGIDIEAVRRAAVGAGIDTTAMTIEEVTGLVLRGDISTATTVTELAGRGVGLDAVRDAVERLGGVVSIASEPGRGTTVDLTVPLSLLAVECLIVDAAGTTVAVPLDAVRQCLRLADAESTTTTVRYAARTVPYLPLAVELRLRSEAQPAVAMIVSAPAGTAAIGVDRVVDTTTVVVRAIPALAPASAVVGGLYLSGEGNPRIVLDPAGLVAAAERGHHLPPSSAPAERRPVLVVDDSLTTRMLERSILESAGYDVDVAASGEEALAKAHQTGYGLFLVDVEMPGMDGFTFIEHTRADPALQHVPSILVSSRASPADRQRGREAGAVMHVAKGAFDQNELLDHIGRLVGSR